MLKSEHTSSALNFSSMISAAFRPASLSAGVNAMDKTTTIMSNLFSSRGSTPSLVATRDKNVTRERKRYRERERVAH